MGTNRNASKQVQHEWHNRAGTYRNATLESFNLDRPFAPIEGFTESNQRSALRKAYDVCKEYDAVQEWLYLFGPVGSGKSHLAFAVLNEYTDNENQDFCSFVDASDLPECTPAEMEVYRSVPILLVDDLSFDADKRTFALLNHRYRERSATVITSNLRISALEPRLRSRIQGMIDQEVIVLASDYRLLPKEY